MLVSLLVLAPVVLKRTPKVDGKATYALKALIDLGGKDDVRYTGEVSQRVKAVVDGTITYLAETRITVDVMGVARQGRPVTSERIERADGRLVQAEKYENTLLFAAPRVDRLRAFVFPGEPVEVGAGWWYAEPTNPTTKAPPYSTYLKLVGEEKVGERDAWKVSLDANEADTESPVRVKGMLWLDKADGSLVRGQWTVGGYVTNPTTPPLNARIEISRTD